MEELIEEYAKEIEKTPEFQRLKELKGIIDKEYASLIVSFKNKEAKYLEAKERPEIFDLKNAQIEFMNAKAKLYNMPLVKEYFELEEKINNKLAMDMSELESSISSHFKHRLF